MCNRHVTLIMIVKSELHIRNIIKMTGCNGFPFTPYNYTVKMVWPTHFPLYLLLSILLAKKNKQTHGYVFFVMLFYQSYVILISAFLSSSILLFAFINQSGSSRNSLKLMSSAKYSAVTPEHWIYSRNVV